MLELLQAAATFNTSVWGQQFTITSKGGATFDATTNEVTTSDAAMTVKGLWHDGIDKVVSKDPNGGVTIVRGQYRAVQIPASDVNGAALPFIPKKGDLLTRTVGVNTERYQIGEAMRFTHAGGEAFYLLYLEGN